MLPDLQYNKDKSVVNDLTTKNGINDFLKFLFTNVLQFKYKDATNKDVILAGDAEWVNTTSYYYPTEYLLAGSVLIYVTDRCAYGFVIDRVFESVDNKEQSSVEILFNYQEPTNKLLKQHISWFMLCNGTAVAATKGTKLEVVKDYIDEDKIFEPNNKGECADPSMESIFVPPLKSASKESLPVQEQIPSAQAPQGTQTAKPSCTFTGYFFMYNLDNTADNLEDTIHLTLNYVRQPIYAIGQYEYISLGNGNIKSYKKNNARWVSISGNNTIVQLPRSSEFYQLNMGDSNTGYTAEGQQYLMVPKFYLGDE